MAMKLRPLSVARALAIMVLLHPGGPKSKTPFGGVIPSRENACVEEVEWREKEGGRHTQQLMLH